MMPPACWCVWRCLEACPGTNRAWHQLSCVGGNIFALGGSTRAPNGAIANVVDNWRFAPATKTWTRLRNLPTSGSVFGGAGGGDSTFEDRYILLLGAYQYDQVFTSVRQSGSNNRSSDITAAAYGVVTHAAAQPHFATAPITPEQRPTQTSDSLYFNDFFVYDTETDLFGFANALPINNASPDQVRLPDGRLVVLGGETGASWIDGEYYGQHPDLALVVTLARA